MATAPVRKPGAPAVSPALLERMNAAHRVMREFVLSQDERVALLAAVVWPQDRRLLERSPADSCQ